MGENGFGQNVVFSSISIEFGAPILQRKSLLNQTVPIYSIYAVELKTGPMYPFL